MKGFGIYPSNFSIYYSITVMTAVMSMSNVASSSATSFSFVAVTPIHQTKMSLFAGSE